MHSHLTSWWNGISLRTKITGVTVMLLTVGLLVAGAGTMSLLGNYLVDQLDRRVQNSGQVIEAGTTGYVTFTDAGCVAVSGVGDQAYLAVLTSEGERLCHNRSDERPAPDLSWLDATAVSDRGAEPFTVTDRDQTNQWRVVAVRVTIDGAPGLYTVVIGENISAANQVVTQFASIFMFFAIAVVVLGGLITRLLVTTTFAPLHDVERTAARFADGDFSQRMSGALPNTEVGRLSRSLNAMLARIDSAFEDRARTIEQMRRFVGDASHELRTPLVSVRGYAELYRMGALGSDDEVRQAMERIEKEAVRMGALVSDLLELARLDETRPLNLAEIDLKPIAHDAAMDARASAPARSVTVVDLDFSTSVTGQPTDAQSKDRARANASPKRFAGAQLARLRALTARGATRTLEPLVQPEQPDVTSALVLAEENKIRQVVTNLMGNAMRFSPEDSPIELGVGVDAERGMGAIAIIDHGRGIPPQIRDKIFQRFWRADTSRTRETGGSGLGLAIVQAIIASHGGVIEVDETPGGGATFTVLLPLAPSARRSTADTTAS